MTHELVTVRKFSELTGLSARTVAYYCDNGTIPHAVLNYGVKKKTRLIYYQEFLNKMRLRKVPEKLLRIDNRPDGGLRKTIDKILKMKQSPFQKHSSKMAVSR